MVDPGRVAIARQVLAQLGVSLADLRPDERPWVPTIGEYLPRVVAAAGPGARRTYGSYWARMAAAWGSRRLDEIAATDIEALQHEIAANAVARCNSRGGRTRVSTSSPPPAPCSTGRSPTGSSSRAAARRTGSTSRVGCRARGVR